MHTIEKNPLFQHPEPLVVRKGTDRPFLVADTGQHGPVRRPGDCPAEMAVSGDTVTVSLIIPNRNGSAALGRCLDAVVPSISAGFEVIVVDDCSTDCSWELIKQYPCRSIRLDRHSGASRARNVGARHSRGEYLFFIDADCILQKDTLDMVRKAFARSGPNSVVGGTYTAEPYDRDFFSRFQSMFIHHAETRRPCRPDYVAGHAMAMHRSVFLKSGGFPEEFLPVAEDVEYSHRLRRQGVQLIMDPAIQVRHIFNFSLGRSLRNAARKTRFWIRYSAGNRDLFADSGTASQGLKVNTAAWLLTVAATLGSAIHGAPSLLVIIPFIVAANAAANRALLRAWRRTGGPGFGIRAAVYYLFVYPAPIAAGAALGLLEHVYCRNRRRTGIVGQRVAERREGAHQVS